MMNDSDMTKYELVCIIVNLGLGSKLIQVAKRYGFTGGTVLLGKGTANNGILNYIGLHEVRREIILLVADKKIVQEALNKLNEEFKFVKPNHGIVYTTSVCAVLGARSCKYDKLKEEWGVDNPMYNLITVIVDKGNAENVIDAATGAGSKGGTIINARGSGIHETSKLFSMDIEPEKEIVMILSKASETERIVFAIREHLKIDEPGKGIIYVQNVNKTYGLYD